MGCLLSKFCKSVAQEGAFRPEMRASLVEINSHKFAPASSCVTVLLESMENIDTGDTLLGTSNPFVEMSIMGDTVASKVLGNQQKQRSSLKPDTINPRWSPKERFHFIVDQLETTKIMISVYHYISHKPKKPKPLGDAILKLKDLKDIEMDADEGIERTLDFINPKTGKKLGKGKVVIKISSVDEACCVQEDMVYEFQRWNILREPNWGHTPPPGHFLSIDPGRWCTPDGKSFGDQLEQVEMPMKEHWYVKEQWHILANADDPDGWEYSSNFNSIFWYASMLRPSYVVRRRKWKRVLKTDQLAYRDSTSSRFSANDSFFTRMTTSRPPKLAQSS